MIVGFFDSLVVIASLHLLSRVCTFFRASNCHLEPAHVISNVCERSQEIPRRFALSG